MITVFPSFLSVFPLCLPCLYSSFSNFGSHFYSHGCFSASFLPSSVLQSMRISLPTRVTGCSNRDGEYVSILLFSYLHLHPFLHLIPSTLLTYIILYVHTIFRLLRWPSTKVPPTCTLVCFHVLTEFMKHVVMQVTLLSNKGK